MKLTEHQKGVIAAIVLIGLFLAFIVWLISVLWRYGSSTPALYVDRYRLCLQNANEGYCYETITGKKLAL